MVYPKFLSSLITSSILNPFIYACCEEYQWVAMGQSGEQWGMI